MKIYFALMTLVLSSMAYAGSPKFDSGETLRVAIDNDQAYFVPKNADDVTSWNGVVYDYETKKCFTIKESPENQKLQASEQKCEQKLVSSATEPYEKISDFTAFKKKFLNCLQNQDKNCLRRLTWKQVQISFGVDGMGDRREKLYPVWKKKDFDEAETLLKKGTSPDGDRREFPFPQKDSYVGMRGAFEKKNDGWLLTWYLGGD